MATATKVAGQLWAQDNRAGKQCATVTAALCTSKGRAYWWAAAMGKKKGKRKEKEFDDTDVDENVESSEVAEMTEDEAATKIQAAMRGKQGKGKMKKKREELRKKMEKENKKLIKKGEMTEEEAALKIQAAMRGMKGRKKAKGAAKKATHLAKAEAKAKGKALKKAHEDLVKDVSKLFKEGEGAYVRADGKRGCTDCIFCLAFMAYWLGALFLSYFAFANGDLDRLIMPRDVAGNSCGMKNERADGTILDLTPFPALYLPNPALPEQFQICTRKCPGSGSKGDCVGNLTRDYTGGAASKGRAALKAAQESGKFEGPFRHKRESQCVGHGDCSGPTGACTLNRPLITMHD